MSDDALQRAGTGPSRADIIAAEDAAREANYQTVVNAMNVLAKEFAREAKKLGLRPSWDGKTWYVPVCAGNLSFNEFAPEGDRAPLSAHITKRGKWWIPYNTGSSFDGPPVSVDEVRENMTKFLAGEVQRRGRATRPR